MKTTKKVKINNPTRYYQPWTLALAAAGLLTLPGVGVADSAPTNSPPTTPSGSPIGTKAHENFWKRFEEANSADLSASAYTPPPPVPAGQTPPPQANRRGLPSPYDSPPFPTGEWQIGGTELIGDQNLTPDYPLMEALYSGSHGQAWSDSRIKIYGWEDFSGNVSTSHNTEGSAPVPGVSPGVNGNNGASLLNGNGANFPLAYDQRPNTFEQNQFVLYAERTPDEFQTDHADWGFRMSWVYGLDYRYMISRGWDSDQLVKRDNFYGMDTPMMYANLYIPNVAQGLNLTLGRIISEADIEAQLAPNNLMSSHSLLYAFDPYCQWGLFGTLKLNKNWTLQLGLSAGNDVTPWEVQDPGCQPTVAAMVQFISDNNKFSFYGGGNCINNAHWGFNNIQQYVGTLTYKFNERWWISHETWYMFMTDCPGQTGGPGSTASHPVPVTAPNEPQSQNGGFGYSDAELGVLPGYAPEWATLDYVMYRLAPNTFLTVRNELFDDIDGQRTGYATLYSEHAIGLTWWPSKLITFRPEIRFDHAYGTHGISIDPVNEARPYDNGTRSSQFTAQFDVIYHF